MKKTHYDTLGVSPGSTQQEIRSAYRKLVLTHHPDQSSDPKSKDILIAAVAAYEIIGDKAKRRVYDESLSFEQARAEARNREAQNRDRQKKHEEEQAAARAQTMRKVANRSIEEDLVRLTKLFRTGRYDDAEQLAREISKRAKREAIPYSVLGDIARARGNLEAAISYYAQAIQCDQDNPLYQKRYEDLLRTSPADVQRQPGSSVGAAMLGVGVCVCACVYIALSNEMPITAGISLVSTWTLGLVGMLFLCGVCVGVALCVGGKLDRFNAVSTTSQGKISPAMALGTIAIVSFWLAAALYWILGATQNAFNFSTSRVVGCVAAVVVLASISAHFSAGISALQVLAWGGNLTYIGAMCGWMVSDSLR